MSVTILQSKDFVRSTLTMGVLFAMALLSGCGTSPSRADACLTPLSATIPNSCVVKQSALWRGAGLDQQSAATLVSLGVKTVVNLQLFHDDRKSFLAARPSLDTKETIDYFRIRDWEPNAAVANGTLDVHVADFLAIVKTQPGPIYVHCRSGQNRTGVMIAAYRMIVERVPIESAVDEMKAYGGIWSKFDAAYLRGMKGERLALVEQMIETRVQTIKREARFECSTAGCRQLE